MNAVVGVKETVLGYEVGKPPSYTVNKSTKDTHN